MTIIKLNILQGRTFEHVFQCSESIIIYKKIDELIDTVPVRIVVKDHGLPDGWPIFIQGVGHPKQLNTDRPVMASILNKDTIELNKLALCCCSYNIKDAYISYFKPYDLTGFKARATIRPHINSPVVFYKWDNVVADYDLNAFILKINANETTEFKWTNGIYDMEAVNDSGEVYSVVNPSPVKVFKEVTR